MQTLSVDTGSQITFSARNILSANPDANISEANKLALKERNAKARELRKAGYSVTTFSLGSQLISLGGIGSGQAHMEYVVKAYGLNYR